MTKARVQIGPGKFVDAQRLDFKPVAEPWCEFDCEDGTRVRIRLLVSEIYRLEGQRTPDGDPVYFVKSQNLMTAVVPEELKSLPDPGAAGEKPGNYA
jgi:hypothetical protein